jgi:dTDP-4-amino-4,6-dideoxygalactose transaminase
VHTPAVPPGRSHVWHQYTIRVTGAAAVSREALMKELALAGIGCGLYYPRLMHDYNCYRGHPQIAADATPNAERIAAEVLSLPVHQHLTPVDLDRIISAVREVFGA